MKPMKFMTLSFLILTLIIGCSPAGPGQGENSSGDSSELTIAIFGGSWGDAIKENIVKPFEKENNIKVNIVEGTSSVTYSRLKQEKNASTIDISLLDSGISELAFQDGLVEPFDPSKLSNSSSLLEQALQIKDSQTYGVALGYWGLGLAYNPEKVKTPPTSWNDLWKSQYQNKVTIPNPETTGGLPFLLKMAELSGGGAKNIEKGFTKIKQLKTVAFFNGSGAGSNLYQSGEAIIGAHYGGPVWSLKDQGVPIDFVIPKEGVIGAGSFWHITKGTQNKDLAMKFLNLAISKQAQKGVSEQLYLAPINKNVMLSEKAAARMPYGKDGKLEDLYMPDYNLINQHRAKWSEMWNKQIGQ